MIVANLLASKLTVLYGPSGVGKSSILRAAVTRRLREVAPGADVAVLHEWTGEPTLPEPADETFLILDQFEEYFLYHDNGALLDVLPELLARPRVHVLISLREDALAQLDAFQARIPNVFSNRLRLDHLDVAAARAAIVGPLDRWNVVAPDDRMGIEPRSSTTVAAEVAVRSAAGSRRRTSSSCSSGSGRRSASAIRPVLRAETLRRLGGAEAIVSAHLERALAALPPREAEIATSALKFLVTPSRTKIAHSFGDLVDYTDESPVELQTVLERLASQRILRAVADGDDDGSRYEIFHDVLAEPVLAWRREFDARSALAASSRRHRRLAAVAGGAALLALAMVALTVYAFAQRSEASKQRRVAEAQTELALGQQKVAEQQRLAAEKQRRVAVTQKHKADLARETRLQARSARSRAPRRRKQAPPMQAKQQERSNVARRRGRSKWCADSQGRDAAARKRNAGIAKRQTRRATAAALVARRSGSSSPPPRRSSGSIRFRACALRSPLRRWRRRRIASRMHCATRSRRCGCAGSSRAAADRSTQRPSARTAASSRPAPTAASSASSGRRRISSCVRCRPGRRWQRSSFSPDGRTRCRRGQEGRA